jgi:hypothetical protein
MPRAENMSLEIGRGTGNRELVLVAGILAAGNMSELKSE